MEKGLRGGLTPGMVTLLVGTTVRCCAVVPAARLLLHAHTAQLSPSAAAAAAGLGTEVYSLLPPPYDPVPAHHHLRQRL